MSGRLPRRRPPSPDIPIPPECGEMIRRGALFALNVSGGKDSQAMSLLVAGVVKPRPDRSRPRSARRGRMARDDRAYRTHASRPRAADPRPRHLRQVAARLHRRTGPVPLPIGSLVYEFAQARTHRARAAALSQSPSPIRRAAGERHGHARGRECGARTFHQRAIAEGRFYEERVAASLSDLVFGQVFPELARAIAAAEPDAPLSEVREAALLLLYRANASRRT